MERRPRSVSRVRGRGAIARLGEEAARSRSVFGVRGHNRCAEVLSRRPLRPPSPPLEMENPFLGGDLGADLASDLGHSANTATAETKGETRRSKKRSKDGSRLRMRSLFTLSTTAAAPRTCPAAVSDVDTRHTVDTRPRHVLSYSSYARPYRSTISLPSLVSLSSIARSDKALIFLIHSDTV